MGGLRPGLALHCQRRQACCAASGIPARRVDFQTGRCLRLQPWLGGRVCCLPTLSFHA